MNKRFDITQYQPIKNALLDEPLESRRRRILAGAMYGFIGGTAYSLLAGTVDALTHPGLPIYIDWGGIAFMWLWLGLGLAFFGALTGWFMETVKGILIGSVSLSLTVLAVNLTLSSVRGAITIVMLLAMALPVAAVCVPIIWALRWIAERHVHTLDEPDKSKRARGLTLLVVVALAVGLVPAAFQRMSAPAEQSVRIVDGLLQQAAAGQVSEDQNLPLAKLPKFAAHIGTGYKLIQHRSKVSMVGYDISIIFSDGYKVTCVLVAYEGKEPYFRGCVEGNINSPTR
jgi:hypothetical protein